MSEFEDDYSDLEVEIEQSDEPEVAELPTPVDWMGLSIRVGRGDRPATAVGRADRHGVGSSLLGGPAVLGAARSARAAARVPAR